MMRQKIRSRLASIAALMFAGAAGAAMADDAMPSLTEAYFAGGCPDGWMKLEAAKGRTLLPSPLGAGSGAYAGNALDGLSVPKHRHLQITGTVDVPGTSFILIDGCCNNNLGYSGNRAVSGSTSETEDGLPFIQYSACIKISAPDQSAVPSGILTFYALPMCAAGWQEETAVQGRYIIGLPDNGTPYYSFGGDPLSPNEIRTHTHAVKGNIVFGGHDIAGGSGCCASGYAASGTFPITGGKTTPVVPPPSRSGTAEPPDSAVNAPYYTATMCRKN
jgi:hypothetical protein